MDVGKALTYVFDDERWISKLIIALIIGLFSWLIFPLFFLIGYAVDITRNVKDGMEKPLPEWEDWGKLFMDGLYIFLAQLVYTLPFLIIMCIGSIATGGMGAAADSAGDPEAMFAMMGTTGAILGCLGLLWMVALIFISPAIIIQYVINDDDFGSCFRFGEVFGIASKSIGDIVIVILVTMGIGLAASVLGGVLSIIPCLGWIAAILISLAISPYITAVSGHLYGQIAAKYNGGNKEEKFAV
jgi:hypothetical protein